MALRRRPTRPHAPSQLTDETERKLLEATSQGVPMEAAAEYAGIGSSTFLRWCAKGREVQDKIVEDEHYEPDEVTEQPYYDLWIGVEDARSKAVVRGVLNVQRAAAGGFVTKEVTRSQRDPVTGQVETIVEKTIQPPDWRAAMALLKTSHARTLFVEAPKGVEVTGADGGPIVHAHVDATQLAARVQGNLQRALEEAAAPALESGLDDGTVEGEVVDDEP